MEGRVEEEEELLKARRTEVHVDYRTLLNMPHFVVFSLLVD